MSNDDRWTDENGRVIDEDHRGLVYDIRTLIDRRRALGIFGGVALTSLLAACGANRSDDEILGTLERDRLEEHRLHVPII